LRPLVLVVVVGVEPFEEVPSGELPLFPPHPDVAVVKAAAASSVRMAVGNVRLLMGWALLVARRSRPAHYQGGLPCLTRLAQR
jgi:hypothetical protein